LNNTDTSFLSTDGGGSPIVPGQYSFAAIDGSNATTWQPSTEDESSIWIDLGKNEKIVKFHLNWGKIPPKNFKIWGGSNLNELKSLVNETTKINAPFNQETAEDVEIRVGNTVSFSKRVEDWRVRLVDR
jgi:hypothetical protein